MNLLAEKPLRIHAREYSGNLLVLLKVLWLQEETLQARKSAFWIVGSDLGVGRGVMPQCII